MRWPPEDVTDSRTTALPESTRMTYDKPTQDLRGTEPARQTDDPSLADSDSSKPIGPTSAADDSRPGLRLGVILLVVFLVVMAIAIVWAVAVA
jgi:hypothetical protein